MSAIGSVIVMMWFFLVVVSPGSQPGDLQQLRWVTRRRCSPRGLGDAGQLAAVGHLPQADAAQAELAVDGLGATAALAAGVAADSELGLAGGLDLERSLRHVSSP